MAVAVGCCGIVLAATGVVGTGVCVGTIATATAVAEAGGAADVGVAVAVVGEGDTRAVGVVCCAEGVGVGVGVAVGRGVAATLMGVWGTSMRTTTMLASSSSEGVWSSSL